MPLSLTATRELLARLGHSPKRFLGQNFLIDGNIVRKSLELADVRAGESVVEVGPGLGTLTSALLEAGAEVWAVEKDAALAAHLRATLGARFPDRLHLLEADAVEQPIAGFRGGAPYKVVANLPYAISTPWMDAVLGGPLPTRMVLMLQQEAAQRYVAAHGSKQFGAISIFVQSAFAADRGHKVAASCFHPAPDVESYLLNLARRPEPFLFPAATKALIRSVFQQRRKQIGSLLRDRLPPDRAAAWLAGLAAAGLGPTARPEQIPVPLWQQLVA
ncbi:MAG TPA: 16S rRNA (adenine(1518)-N(6)/adenine(1519)-N(6))-dimethyltransferase RsmA [Opitutaceae bacterium]|nr:16S rRNA (adenine(1518)-N(6)/adenine(1519)-N(6))-dimethyltransferase RsmA [Opitutaceae bacterium]